MPSEGAGAVGGAAGQYVRLTNVAHRPDRDVTEADCEKLLDWIDERWGKMLRDEHEANRWWTYLSALPRKVLAFACREVKDGPRPTLGRFQRACFRYGRKE